MSSTNRDLRWHACSLPIFDVSLRRIVAPATSLIVLSYEIWWPAPDHRSFVG